MHFYPTIGYNPNYHLGGVKVIVCSIQGRVRVKTKIGIWYKTLMSIWVDCFVRSQKNVSELSDMSQWIFNIKIKLCLLVLCKAILFVICDSMWSFCVDANMCSFYMVWLYMYMYCRWRSSYQEGWVGISLTGLTPPHICSCSKPRPGHPTSYVVVLLCSVSSVKRRLMTITV